MEIRHRPQFLYQSENGKSYEILAFPASLKKPSGLIILGAIDNLVHYLRNLTVEVGMSYGTKKQWILARRPEGIPDNREVMFQSAEIPATPAEHVLVENQYISLDPANRQWMTEVPSYYPPIPIGDPIAATTVSKVLESRSQDFQPGDIVVGLGGWQTHSTLRADSLMKIPEDNEFPLHYYLSILGAVGLTPYFAIVDTAQAKAGQTMLMSTAAGAVGSIGGQIAKILGLRVVGIAGTEEKCNWVVEELGFDDCINYRTSTDMEADIKLKCPEGVDFYYDNVGGRILDAALMNMNKNSTLLFCGTMSDYNTDHMGAGPQNYWQILARTITVKGYIISDYFHRFPEGQAQMAEWVKTDKIKFREHINEGIENCLDSFHLLFSGENQGKLMLKL